MAVVASSLAVASAHAIATYRYEVGYHLQYCPFFVCDTYNQFSGASGTVSSSYPTPASTDTYSWALSLDNFHDNIHTWFQAGIVVGLDPQNNFHSTPVFYVEIQTATSYTFQTFPTSAYQHDIAICASGVVCPWGLPLGSAGLEARLDGNTKYNVPDPFPSGSAGPQQFFPSAWLEVHQAGASYTIPVLGSWFNLVFASGADCVLDCSWCGAPWGALYCAFGFPTNSQTFTAQYPTTNPQLYFVDSISPTSFQAGDPPQGGGGSVAFGSLITLWDGTREPVQNVREGSQVVVYNVPTAYSTTAKVTQIIAVTVDNQLTLYTSVGLPFRADANPFMRIWVLTSDGPSQKPITMIQPGDEIFNYDLQQWVPVTHITAAFGGSHTMFDLITNPNRSPTGYFLEYIVNGYPDCPPRGCKM